MSGFQYDEVGEFSDAGAAEDWARENGIDPADVDICPSSEHLAQLAA